MSQLPAYGLLAAELTSVTGTRMSLIAVPWFVLDTTGDALLTGLAAFVEMGALVATKVLSGPLVDRVGPRVVSVTGDLAAGLALGVVPLLHVLDVLSFPALLVLVGHDALEERELNGLAVNFQLELLRLQAFDKASLFVEDHHACLHQLGANPHNIIRLIRLCRRLLTGDD